MTEIELDLGEVVLPRQGQQGGGHACLCNVMPLNGTIGNLAWVTFSILGNFG